MIGRLLRWLGFDWGATPSEPLTDGDISNPEPASSGKARVVGIRPAGGAYIVRLLMDDGTKTEFYASVFVPLDTEVDVSDI